MRIGIATGLVVVGDLIGAGSAQEQAVVGETPNLAARLQALAEPNTIVIAESTRRQIGGLFEVHDLGPQTLKGFAEPQSAWRVLSENRALGRFEALRSSSSPLVGRDEEVELLLRRWAQAKGGSGRVALISGEPGVGKSRLAEALVERIASERHVRLRYFCSPHHQDSPFHPVIGQMERAAGFAHADSAEEKLGKLRAVLAAVAPPHQDVALIAELHSLPTADIARPLDVTPQRKKEMTFEALLRQVQDLSRQQPVLMVFEDIHWIDPSSRELVDGAIERLRAWPVMLLATFRPEFEPPWIGQPHVAMLTLARLDRHDTAAMVANIAGNAALPEDVVQEIADRTDGVPLFVEELTNAILESGSRAAPSAVPHAAVAVPATLHASLMARLDRLGPVAKNVAQAGAAIGREFSYELLSASIGAFDQRALNEALQRLVAAGLVFQRGTPPAAEYLFKHALIQDTAYGTLLRDARRDMHRRVGEALETQFLGLIETRPEIAAHHFGEALQADKAVAYWLRAGRMSATRSAVREAETQLRRGLDLLGTLPENRERKRRELDVLVTLTPALMGARGYADPEVAALLDRSRQLVTDTGQVGSPLHFSVLYGTWVAAYVGGNGKRTMDLAGEFHSLAEAQSASGLCLIGHRILGASLMLLGNYREALPHLIQAASLYRPDEHREFAFRYGQDIGASALCYLAWALWHSGYPEQATLAADRALGQAANSGTLTRSPMSFGTRQ